METLSHNVARFNQQAAHPWQLAFSWGCVEYDPASHPSLNALVATADRLMYQSEAEAGTRAPLILRGGGLQQVLLRLLPLLRIAVEQRLLRFPFVIVKQAAFVGDKAIMLFQLVYHPVNALQGE